MSEVLEDRPKQVEDLFGVVDDQDVLAARCSVLLSQSSPPPLVRFSAFPHLASLVLDRGQHSLVGVVADYLPLQLSQQLVQPGRTLSWSPR